MEGVAYEHLHLGAWHRSSESWDFGHAKFHPKYPSAHMAVFYKWVNETGAEHVQNKNICQ